MGRGSARCHRTPEGALRASRALGPGAGGGQPGVHHLLAGEASDEGGLRWAREGVVRGATDPLSASAACIFVGRIPAEMLSNDR
jgi:hypothetical protein